MAPRYRGEPRRHDTLRVSTHWAKILIATRFSIANRVYPPLSVQQLVESVVVGDVSRPTVRGGHGRVERLVCVGEPLRAGVVKGSSACVS